MAQTTIVQNYLTAKYNLDLRDGVELQRLYSNTDYIYDIIGVGKAMSLDNNSEEEHLNSGGGALELISNGFAAAGDYVFAGHNGAEIEENETTKAWSRVWNVEFIGGASDVTIGFDFGKADLPVFHQLTINCGIKQQKQTNGLPLTQMVLLIPKTRRSFDLM